jgi:hypothetical protein
MVKAAKKASVVVGQKKKEWSTDEGEPKETNGRQ